ncbi:hypothetical protein, partial [Klebsiella pneumoniae]|uniref:hypothetical protein n=1 Tax=Klebsiella pneumoniae TaxID=573 RepID=UPI001D0E484F
RCGGTVLGSSTVPPHDKQKGMSSSQHCGQLNFMKCISVTFSIKFVLKKSTVCCNAAAGVNTSLALVHMGVICYAI